MPEKNDKQLESVESCSPVGGKVEELCRKGFVEKMSFEPGVEERRGALKMREWKMQEWKIQE